ncbi:hypothetical protein BGZ52_002304, partial [Haplosporangium bisporale]
MAAFPLPIECLQLIITNLAIKRELKTLASLLRVSKHVCLATLPILYKDPFVWFTRSDQGQQDYHLFNSYDAVIPVVRLLPASVPNDSYSGLVHAMYGDGNVLELPEASTLRDPPIADDDVFAPSTSRHWPIDYLSYVCHVNTQDQDGTSVLANFVVYKELAPRLKSYVEDHKLTETYAAMAVNTGRLLDLTFMKEDPLTCEHLTLNIHREATWALCSPILEQLQSIVIPLSDIDHYFSSICRLSSLASVTFRLDELSDVDEHLAGQMDTEE